MPRAVGIDLGTTYSCVAAVVNGKVEVIANRDFGQRTTPSCVAFVEGEERELVGEAALSQAARNPANTIVEAKRLIGRHFMDEAVQADIARWPFTVTERDGRPLLSVQHQGEPLKLSPQQVSSMVLRKLKADAEAFLGETVVDAVITVPAYFTDSQLRATKEAGEMAGLRVLQLIPEPTAAAVAFGVERQSLESRRVLVYDLGGGTFDVSVVQITGGRIGVKAVGGHSHLGGSDVDQLVVEYVAEEIKRKLGTDVRGELKKMRRLLTLCERAKRDLSAVTKAFIDVENVVIVDELSIGLQRAKFEDLIKGLLTKTADIVKSTLDSAKIGAAAIDEVLLVGGSTRMPCVERLLEGLFPGKPISKAVNADEAVAQGAAIWAAVKTGENAAMLQGLDVQNVTPLSIGVASFDGGMGILIPRNHAIPTKVATNFYTPIKDTSKVSFPIYQGERCVATRNKYIGGFILSGVPRGPPGRKINFELSIDEDGVLSARAKLCSKKAWTRCILRVESLSTTDIISNLEDVERYHEEDQLELQRLSAESDLLRYLHNNKDEIPAEHMPELEQIQRWLADNKNASTIEYRQKLADWKSRC